MAPHAFPFEDLLVEAYHLGEHVRSEATLAGIARTFDRCSRGCDAQLRRIEYRLLPPGETGRVLIVQRCPICKAEVRVCVPVLPGLTADETRALPPVELLARLSAAAKRADRSQAP